MSDFGSFVRKGGVDVTWKIDARLCLVETSVESYVPIRAASFPTPT